jgi:flagellin
MLRPVAGSEMTSARVGCQSREDNRCRKPAAARLANGELRDKVRKVCAQESSRLADQRGAMSGLSPLTATSRWINAPGALLETATRRLATMRRINSAADDAAGLAISERFLAQMNGERVARQATMDGLSLAETAGGALGQVSSNLQRMRELALQSRNGTLSDGDRASLDTEYRQLAQEVNRVVGGTSFNGQKILAQDAGDRQISTGPGARDTLSLTTPDLRSDTDLASATGGHVTSAAGSASLVDAIDGALESVNGHRAALGASERRLQAAAETSDLRFESAARAHDTLTAADPAATASAWRSAQVQQYAAISMFRQDAGAMRQLLSLFG